MPIKTAISRSSHNSQVAPVTSHNPKLHKHKNNGGFEEYDTFRVVVKSENNGHFKGRFGKLLKRNGDCTFQYWPTDISAILQSTRKRSLQIKEFRVLED